MKAYLFIMGAAHRKIKSNSVKDRKDSRKKTNIPKKSSVERDENNLHIFQTAGTIYYFENS